MKGELNQVSLDQLKEFLLTNMNRGRLTPSEKEFCCACPYCGDSRSDQYATSFYINIDPASENFLKYHCFRASCGTSGIVNEEFFDMIGFSNRDCAKDIYRFLNDRGMKIGGKYKSKDSKSLINVINTKSPVSDKKKDYINSRLGLDLSYKDLYNLKINLSLNELLKINGIKIKQDQIPYYENLSNYGISFISAYNDYVIVRDISKSNKLRKRYTNINIFENYENVTKAYCMPTEIDLLDPSPCVINISEGVFDIISVYHNLNIDKKYKNQIYLAACGSGIINVLVSYIQQYGLINSKINIFSDGDVNIDKYSPMRKLELYLKKFDVDVYYNSYKGEKDFGVPKNRINVIKAKL